VRAHLGSARSGAEHHDAKRSSQPTAATAATQMLALQRSTGNAAASAWVRQARNRGTTDIETTARPVQRSLVHDVLRAADHPLLFGAQTAAGLGSDVTDVRTPTGIAPQRSADEMRARAYTSGDDHVEISIQRAGPWKSDSTATAVRAVKRSRQNDPFVDTLHHIIPKEKLRFFTQLLEPQQIQFVATSLAPIAPSAFPATPLGFDGGARNFTEYLEKALQNLPANYVIGPKPYEREDDPIKDPDYNYGEAGTMTPRSTILEGVYEFIDEKIRDQIPPGNQDLFQHFIVPLMTASNIHNFQNIGPNAYPLGIDPGRAGWSGDPATRTARRRRPAPPPAPAPSPPEAAPGPSASSAEAEAEAP
jgi:hypothetical protein